MRGSKGTKADSIGSEINLKSAEILKIVSAKRR